MTGLIAWCGSVGAWLLVFGPLNQGIREVREEEFERESIQRAEGEIEVPPEVSSGGSSCRRSTSSCAADAIVSTGSASEP
jgi:hypothetical protein